MFLDEVRTVCRQTGGALCVGLDPHADRIPPEYGTSPDGVRRFLRYAIEATAPYAGVFKPNSAFFESLGDEGLTVLRETIRCAHDAERPVILDAKRGDIASTARAYACSAKDGLDADAITLVPYMGEGAVIPFLDRGLFAILLTLPSNPSAESIVKHGTPPLYLRIAELGQDLASRYPGQVGLVVGATRPAATREIHDVAPTLPWLVPGVGAQGGSLDELRAALPDAHEMWVNVSRGVLFDEDPAEAAKRWKETIGVWFDG